MNETYTTFIIDKVIEETSDTKTFIISRKDKSPTLYQSGQFITLVFNSISGEHRRSFSISSAPCCDNELAFTVKKNENGNFSRYLADRATTGEKLLSTGISGFFTLPENTASYEQIFFIAAGSGITPVFSLIKTALYEQQHLKINLLYSTRNEEQTIFYNQLEKLQRQFPERFTIDYFFSASPNLLRARINNTLLTHFLHKRSITDFDKTLFYVCGPFEYMDTVFITLLTEGVPKENLRKESFSTFKPDIKELPPDTQAHNVTIKLSNQSAKTITVQHPQSILSKALEENVKLPYSCESGQCGSCAARLISGKVWMSYNEVLTDKELNNGLVLTCMGFPVGGDVVLEF